MARTGITRRVVLATSAAGSALALAGCGSDGVLTNGSTAATYGSYTVSTSEVHEAVTDINRVEQQGGITGQQAAVLLALEPEISKIAGRYGVRVTPSQVEDNYRTQMPKGESLNDAAIRTIQASVQLNGLESAQGGKGAAATKKLVEGADIELNPRYGTYSKGNMAKTPTNWIAQAPAESAQQ